MKPLRLAVAALALLAGCNSSEPTGVVNLSGDLAFAYTGALSGSFSASGQMPQTTTEQRTMDWAAGERDDPDIFVDAAVPRSATTYDVVFLSVGSTTVGSSDIAFDADVTILLGAQVSGTGQPLQVCFLNAGTVAITEITATRVKGTFSGTGSCVDPTPTTTSFTVANGTFDVPLVAP